MGEDSWFNQMEARTPHLWNIFSLTLVILDVVAKETTLVPWQFEQIN
jgi:hypothetical protein